jgi:hypothetical protein
VEGVWKTCGEKGIDWLFPQISHFLALVSQALALEEENSTEGSPMMGHTFPQGLWITFVSILWVLRLQVGAEGFSSLWSRWGNTIGTDIYLPPLH